MACLMGPWLADGSSGKRKELQPHQSHLTLFPIALLLAALHLGNADQDAVFIPTLLAAQQYCAPCVHARELAAARRVSLGTALSSAAACSSFAKQLDVARNALENTTCEDGAVIVNVRLDSGLALAVRSLEGDWGLVPIGGDGSPAARLVWACIVM